MIIQKETTGAELLNKMLPVPIRYKGKPSQPGGQVNGSLISVFSHLQTVGPSRWQKQLIQEKEGCELW